MCVWTLSFVSSVFKWMPTASKLKINLCICLRLLPEKKKKKKKKQKKKKQTVVLLTVFNIDSKSRPAFLPCVDATWSHLSYLIDTVPPEPWTRTSGYSRDAIFSQLHFDNLGDSIFISTLQKKPWNWFYFNWVALLQRKEQKKSFFLLRKKIKKSWSVFVLWLCRMRCLAFVWVSMLFCIYDINIYKYKNAVHCILSHRCMPPWVLTLPKCFLFLGFFSLVWISWWIHSCFLPYERQQL